MPIKTFFGLLFFIQLTFSAAVWANNEDTDQVTPSTSEITADDLSPTVMLNVDNYGVSEGLSQSIVTSVAEDDEGYIWVGTINGLNRFDGKSFKQFYVNDGSGLDSSFIKALYFDKSKQQLYVGTDKGLQIYKAQRESFERTEINEPVINISGNKSEISIILSHDIISIKNSLKSYQNLETDDIKNSTILNGELYILTYSGKLYKNNILLEKDVTSINSNDNDFFYLKNNNIYKNNHERILTLSDKAYSFILKNKRELIVFQQQKTINYDLITKTTTEKNIEKINFFKKNIIKKLNNGIFISNYANGFTMIWDNRNIVNTIPLRKQNIWSIRNDDNYTLVTDQSEFLEIYDSTLSNLIASINVSKKGAKSVDLLNNHIYVGTSSGLDIYLIENNAQNTNGKNLLSITYEKTLALSTSIVKKIDNTIYVGTIDGQIFTLDDQTNEITGKFDTKNNSPIFDITKGNTDDIYIGSQSGLLHLKNSNLQKIYSDDLVFSVKAFQKSVYFGTSDKLIKLDNDYSTTDIYTTGKPIFSISSDSNLLIASSVGELLTIFNEQIHIIDKNFGAQEEYNSQSAVDFEDKFVVGGINGLSILNKDSFIKNLSSNTKTTPKIASYSVFNIPASQSQSLDFLLKRQSLSLGYTDYPFTFFFSSPGSNHTNNLYYYRMKGLSDTWISSNGIDNATYTNLSPGDYEFQLYSVNPLTGEKSDTQIYKVEIRPPFWMTIEAKILYVITSLFFIIIIFRAFLRRRAVQRQIAQSEERLKLSLWGSGDEMWDWDIESGKIYRSNIWGALEFPQDGQRAPQSGKESNIHPQDIDRVKDALDKHFNGETNHFEATYRVRGNTGEWLWILDRAKIVERDDKDKPLRMTGTIKNINSFKSTEEQLKLFERAIENISEGVFILDTRFHFVEVNDATCDITKCVKEQLIATPLYFSKYSDEYNRQIMILLQQQGRWMTEIEAVRGDGTEFLMELSIDAIYDEVGELTHFVGVFSDISLRKKQEAELRRLTNTDLLTALPNRSSLLVTLENLVKKDTHHTLMMMQGLITLFDQFQK